MTRFRVFALLAALCTSVPALAQNTRITGIVRNADGGAPIFGASVEVNAGGTSRGAVTREDGRYTIAVEPGTYTVRVRRIGFSTDSATGVVVRAGASATANFTLKASATQIVGVTVTGYGTQEVRDITGSVKAVTAKDFNPGRVVSAEQLIQAKVPGVQIVDNNEPGGGMSIRIRGGTSINASNEPLIVVDGVPLNIGGGLSSGRNPLNFLNPNDIKEITVLKDAQATAIYGSRGANGVLMITTKSGSAAEPVLSYSSNFSTSTAARTPDLLSPNQFRTAVTTYANSNVGRLGAAQTNWLDQVLRSAAGVENNVSLAGIRDDARYRLSVGTLRQDGVLAGTTAERVTLALTYSDLMLNDQLEFRTNLKGSRSDDFYTPGGVLGAAISMDPTQAPLTGNSYYQYTEPLGPNNPLQDLAQLIDRGQTYRTVGNIEAKYFIPQVAGLSATLRTGFDLATSQRTSFSPSTAQQDVESARGGRFDRSNPRQFNTVFELFGNYNRKVMGATVDLTGGYTYEEQTGDYPYFWAEELSTDLLTINGVPSAGLQNTSLFVEDARLISFFGRANISIDDRFLIAASLRRDGSSRFGPENQWGLFPSVSAAWRLTNEPFMAALPFSDLKLRASWGVNGNQAFGNYLYIPTYTFGGAQAQYQFGNTFVSTIRPSAVDPNIKWEQTASTNVGVDFGLFNDRITGSLDVYSKTTDDLIFTVPVAAGTATSNFVTTNIGSMRNSGIELGITATILDGRTSPWKYDASFAISSNTNELTAVSGSGTDQILTGGIAGGVGSTIQVLQPGSPVNSFFVYRHKKDANGKYVTGDKTDAQLYEDLNGDGVINQNDREVYKNPAPRMIIGHTSTASYKAWDFSLTARAYLGNHVYNNVASNLGHYSGLRGGAPTNRHASVIDNGFVNPQYFSSLYVEDASFLRIDNISAGYTLRDVFGASSVRVFGTVQNLFTTTKYSGVDPLAGVNGIDNNLFPLARTLTVGFNVGF
jgi:iron complex outermembrane receptor protein